nr:hypothetical protein [uncultured Mediterranean phage uvMED]
MEARSFQLNDRVEVTNYKGLKISGRIISRTFYNPMLYDIETDQEFQPDRTIIKYVEGSQLNHV